MNPSVSSQIHGDRESGNDSFMDPTSRHFFTTNFMNETAGADSKEKEEVFARWRFCREMGEPCLRGQICKPMKLAIA
jgi:hypothetical protein